MIAKATIKIGPADHGRRMSLQDFDHAEVQEGYIYELGRGVIIVSDVPKRRHLLQVTSIREQLTAFKLGQPGKIDTIAAGGECKLLIGAFESERHPDIAVYLTPPVTEENLWATWIPALVVEVISPGSEERDYEDKREEYLTFGVREYWIVDAEQREILVLCRSGTGWTERHVRPPKVLRTRLLRGFALDTTAVFGTTGSGAG
jgi:putative restriction endonuclease